jgi:outer membrane protein assembly factor BamB
MTIPRASEASPRKPLRLWPGVAAVTVQWLAMFVAPRLVPAIGAWSVLAGAAGGVVVLVWWLFFSRASWVERLGAPVVWVATVAAMFPFVHESIENGFMGNMLPIFSVPLFSLGLVASAAAGRGMSAGRRRALIAVTIVLACGAMTLIRTEGITGEAQAQLRWRWSETHEEQLLAQSAAPLPSARGNRTAPSSGPTLAPPETPVPGPAADTPAASTAPAAAKGTDAAAKPAAGAPTKRAGDVAGAEAEWPGFRGPDRDSVIRGVRIETDWSQKPPVELWRRPIGPGWSSFAVRGDLAYTQEQRGEHEIVSCYRLSTGEPVWAHRDPVRFWESNGGAGPRATPAVRNGRVYTMGATGIVNALDAGTGAVIWSRDAQKDTGAPLPGWGFTGSPLLFDDAVIVAASGRLVAYDAGTGVPRWSRRTHGGGYSSPHLVTIDGVPQIVLLSGGGATALAPADGAPLWEYMWEPGVNIVQPAVAENGDLLLTAGDAMGGFGIRRVVVARGSGQWTVEQRWESRGLKPYFNDFVVHKGHAFGFDGSILACIDLQNGERKWKGGRYGHGQIVLLPEQDVLFVVSEEGELALVSATADGFKELARVKAIEGKTWNHPVLVGNVLLVRNGEEMAAFRLSLAAGVEPTGFSQ